MILMQHIKYIAAELTFKKILTRTGYRDLLVNVE